RPGRCSWSTAATTRWSRPSTPASLPTPTARPSCGSSTGPGTRCATTPGRSPFCSAGSTASATRCSADGGRRPARRSVGVVGLRPVAGLHHLLPLPHPLERLGGVDVGHRPGLVVGERRGGLLPALGADTEPLGQQGAEDLRLL